MINMFFFVFFLGGGEFSEAFFSRSLKASKNLGPNQLFPDTHLPKILLPDHVPDLLGEGSLAKGQTFLWIFWRS